MAAKKCNCNLGWWVVWLILTTVGVWAIATAFITQLGTGAAASVSATAMAVMPWYFAGILLAGLGKMAKWRCWGMCTMHKK